MDRPEEPGTVPSGGRQSGGDVRYYLAEERTFLAWIRTSLGLMGFGFVVARLGLFSLWSGVAFMAIGAGLNLLSIRRHVRVVEELNALQRAHRPPAQLAVALAYFLTIVGIVMALYLALA
jgi:putative membrane protein